MSYSRVEKTRPSGHMKGMLMIQNSRKEDQVIKQLVSLLEENNQSDLIDCVDIEQLLSDVTADSGR